MAHRRVFQRAAARRKTNWEGAAIDMTCPSSGSIFQSIILEDVLENIPSPTIVRIRGRILVRETTAGAATTRGTIAIGIKLATASAIVAGIGSIEDPLTGIGSDWIWWDTLGLSALDSGLGDTNSDVTFERIVIDSKAMRKVGNNMGLVIVAQHTAFVSTQTVQITGGVRILLKV